MFKAINEKSFNDLVTMKSHVTGLAKDIITNIIASIEKDTSKVNIRSVFTFAELSSEVQAKVIERNTDINIYDGWDEFIIEQAVEDLEVAGFGECKIAYSGFCSQGDGASFTTEGIDLEKYMRSAKIWSKYRGLHRAIKESDLTMSIKRFNHHYSHENTTSVEYNDWYLNSKEQQLASELHHYITEDKCERSRKLYRTLNDIYYHQTSEEMVKEALLEQNDEYTIDGKVI